MEHFPFDAGECEDRQIDERDDQYAEEHRAADLLARFMHGLQALFGGKFATEFMLSLAQHADDVFHHHDGTVDDESEVHRTKGHEVS